MNKPLSIAYSITLPHAIWRMDFHPVAHTMAIEIRNGENGLAHFTVFDYKNGQLLLDSKSYGDRWWTLASVSGDHLFLCYYANPDLPNTSALAAVSLDTGEMAWEKFNIVLEGMTGEGPVAQLSHMPNGFLSLLEPASGNVLRNYLPDQVIPYLARPIFYPSAINHLPSLAGQIENTVGPWHYLRYGEKDFWAVHQQKNNGFQVRLIVTNGEVILHNAIIIDNLAKLLPEIFFIIKAHLFVISGNKRQIIAYKV